MTRIFIRIATASGPRVIISQDLTERDASEICHALWNPDEAEILARIVPDATPVDMKAVLRRMGKAVAQSIPKPLSSNVMPIRKPKP